jgi:hypothetical protein
MTYIHAVGSSERRVRDARPSSSPSRWQSVLAVDLEHSLQLRDYMTIYRKIIGWPEECRWKTRRSHEGAFKKDRRKTERGYGDITFRRQRGSGEGVW